MTNMEKNRVIRVLLEDARENGAYDAVVVDVPPEIVERNGGLLAEEADEHGRRVASTLFAGPVQEETGEELALRSPSRVGGREDFSDNVRVRVVDDVYGFRDGALDGVALPKDEIEVYRAEEP